MTRRRRKSTPRERAARSTIPAGLLALLAVVVVVYLAFTKALPFQGHFELQATFQQANSIRPNSPVRIAGVQVGKVTKIEGADDSNAAVVTMRIDEDGLPVHRDATAKIRPRIFLEGNFFVDLKPGTPAAPELEDGDALPVTQTATPVQLDQVLTSLQSDTRDDLRDTLDQAGAALTAKPTAAQDADGDPSTRGQSAAQSLNDAIDDAAPALRSTAQVLDAMLGTEPDRDIQRLIAGLGRASSGLVRDEQALQGLVVGFDRTMGALASEQGNLRQTIHELPGTLAQADGALDALNASFPPTRALARELIPGVRETPATITAGLPWIAQTRRLLSEKELRGVARRLAPATGDLAKLTDQQRDFLPRADLVSRCALDVVLPTGNTVIRDEFSTGQENYKEFFYGMVGLAGEGQNFDGNGPYVRFAVGGGTQTLSLGSGAGALFGNSTRVPLGTRPRFPGKRSPYRPDVPCHTNQRPDLNGPAAAKGPGERPVAASARKAR